MRARAMLVAVAMTLRSSLPAVLSLISPLVGACSFTFNAESPEVPLIGDPPPAGRFPRLNRAPAGNLFLLPGADGAPWAVIDETPVRAGVPQIGGPRPQATAAWRLVRLAPPAAEETLQATRIGLLARSVLLQDPAMDMKGPTRIAIHRPGDTGKDQVLSVPAGRLMFLADAQDLVLAVWVLDKTTTTYQVFRRDGTYLRTLAVPPGLDPERPFDRGRLVFDSTADYLFAQDAGGLVVAHGTIKERDVDLGAQPRGFLPDPAQPALLACDDGGLRRVAADGSGAKELDPAPCEPGLLRLLGDSLLTGGAPSPRAAVREVRQVPLAGGPARVLLRAALEQVLALDGPDRQVVYSRDPASRYDVGVGDGWLGDWRFMERGRSVTFSADGTRLRWLEDAATSEKVGELLSAQLPGGAPLHLAFNVGRYSEVAPGKVLAIANAAYKGTQNRLILIDEAARRARWVVDSARDYTPIPGSNDLLVRTVTGPGFDVVRVPLTP